MAYPEAPSWIDAAFLQEALRHGGDADTKVTSVTLRPAIPFGVNAGSTIYRATAETAAGPVSLLCKIPSWIPVFNQAFKETNTFRQEALMMSDLVPKMQKLLDDAAPGRFPPFSAKCLHHGHQPDDFLVLEDLTPQGYRMADGRCGLGLRHSLLALRTLARFHAASAALLAQDPSLAGKLINTFGNMGESHTVIIKIGFQMVAAACRQWEDFPRECADALEAAKDTAWNRYGAIHEPLPGRFNTIIHGDFWANNMMFRYEDGEVRDIRLVDFQICHVASPTVDLVYFLSASVSEDVSANHMDLLLREYHVALKETLELLGLDAPSLEDILQDFNKNAFYLTFGATCILPGMRYEGTIDKELMERMFAGEIVEEALDMYKSPKVQRWLRRVLPEYLEKGWLL